jgi:hypothetical protein
MLMKPIIDSPGLDRKHRGRRASIGRFVLDPTTSLPHGLMGLSVAFARSNGKIFVTALATVTILNRH